MKILKTRKKSFKLPILKDPHNGEIIAMGECLNKQITYNNKNLFVADAIENIVFETSLKFEESYYSGYSIYVLFVTEDDMIFPMSNRGAIKLIRMICDKSVKVAPDGSIRGKFTFGKRKHMYYIYPIE